METLRILIADDHPPIRYGLRLALQLLPEAEVVGEAGDGAEAVSAAERLQPDIVIMDLHMPVLDGVEAIRQILHTSPHITVLVLTMYDDDSHVFAAMRAGARGYLLKGADQEEIARGIQLVQNGGAIFGPSIATRMLRFFSTDAGTKAAFPALTNRERQVLELIAQGKNNQKISRELFIAPKTVRHHISNIFAKLQVADRYEAIVRARQAGYGELGIAGPDSPGLSPQ